jgi:hypothetical protein
LRGRVGHVGCHGWTRNAVNLKVVRVGSSPLTNLKSESEAAMTSLSLRLPVVLCHGLGLVTPSPGPGVGLGDVPVHGTVSLYGDEPLAASSACSH